MDSTVIKMKRLSDTAQYPAFQSAGAAGADIYADDDCVIKPGNRAVIKTGIAMAMLPGYEAQIRPRSGLAAKHGITVLNSPGTIDSDYRGEVGVILINHGAKDFPVKIGDRIAQMVIAKHERPDFRAVLNLDETVRGDGAYGSTGA